MAAECNIETFACGCSITFGHAGEVRAVNVCEKHNSIFTEHKSLIQLSMDINHQQMMDKHAPPPVAQDPTDVSVTTGSGVAPESRPPVETK